MRTHVFSILLLSLLFFKVSAAPTAKLKWGYVNFPPYHYSKNGKVTGIIVEEIDHTFRQANIAYTSTELPNKRAKIYINEGVVDFTVVIDSFIANQNQFLKSKKPIYHIVLGAICNEDNWHIATMSDLKSLDLILISGYTYGQKKEFWKGSGYNVTMTASNHADAIKALTYKRGDCVLGYQAPFSVELQKYANNSFYFHEINALPAHLFLNKNVPEAHKIIQQVDKFNL